MQLPFIIILSAAGPVMATGGGDNRAFVEAAIMPAVHIATTAARDTTETGAALGRATAGLTAFLKRNPGQLPDQALVKTCLSLLMRMNTGLLKGPLGYRRYPAPADFERFSLKAAAGLAGYSGALRGEEWGKKEHQGVSDILYRELKNGTAFLPRHGERVPKPPPLSPEEKKFFGRETTAPEK